MARHVVIIDTVDEALADQLQTVIGSMRLMMDGFDYDQSSHYSLYAQKTFYQEVVDLLDQGMERLHAAAEKRGLDIDSVVVDPEHGERADLEGGPNVN